MAQAEANGRPRAVIQTARVVSSRRARINSQNTFVTVLRLPARDQFDTPASLEILSLVSLGQAGDDVKGVTVELSGYGRKYKHTDPQHGVVEDRQTADNILWHVQA